MESIEPDRSFEDWEVISRMLPMGWEARARSSGALRRIRGIRDPTVLLRTLLVHLADGCSLSETAVRVREAGWCRLSAVALFKRLQASEEWLRWLAEQLWRGRCTTGISTDRRVRAVDATTVRESGRTGSQWRVHYGINLSNLQCEHFEVTDVRGGETFRRVPVSPGDLILGDRAYGTPPGVAYVTGRGGDVLVRINLRMLPLYRRDGAKLGVLRLLRQLRVGQAREWPAYVHASEGVIAGRLVAVKRSRQAAQRVRTRMVRQARHQQRSPSGKAIEAAGYVFVWTSLPAKAFPGPKVLVLYRVRWQIELAFKRMKSILGLGQLPKQADASARAWLHGKLFIALLLDRLLHEAEAFSPWGYSLESAPESLAGDEVHVP